MPIRFFLCLSLAISGLACTSPDEIDFSEDAAAAKPVKEDPRFLQGRWHNNHDDIIGAGAQAEMIEQLEAIGYAQGSIEAGDMRGVVLHDHDKAMQGYNLYTSGHETGAVLMDMDGNLIHHWECSYEKAFAPFKADKTNLNYFFWRRVYPRPNGDMYTMFEGLGVLKLDKDSNVIWSSHNGAHHDLDFADDGRIITLSRDAHVKKSLHPTWPILEDYVTIMTPEGEDIRTFSLIDAFYDTPYVDIWLNVLETYPFGEYLVDSLHTNTLVILDGKYADRSPAFKKGNLLIASLKLNTIFIVDPETEKVVWAWDGGWNCVHEPSFVENGDMLFFVNRGIEKDEKYFAKVVQADPITQKVKWEFGGTESVFAMISYFCGTTARLPNGNTMITVSESGRAIEVTPDSEIVWDFRSPHRAGSEEQFVATIFDMIRLPEDYPLDWAQHPPE